MKKVIYLLFVISFMFVFGTALACTQEDGVTYPTIDSVLSGDDTVVALYEITVGGQNATAQLFIGNENSAMNIKLAVDLTDCGVRSNDFVVGEYIVVVLGSESANINHSQLDDQFSFFFSTLEEAVTKYNELIYMWENREVSPGTVLGNGDVVYTPTESSLKPGMKNDDVLALQTALKIKLGLGEVFKLDSSYGPATTSAVKQFQVSEELVDDGIAGVLTQAKLAGVVIGEEETIETNQSGYSSVGYSLKPGMKNDDVLALQTALKIKLGLGEEFKLDSSYGPATTSAVKQFQVSEELVDDGIAGVLTQAKLAGTEVVEPNNEEGSQEEGGDENGDGNNAVADGELKRILIRAKNEIIYYAVGGKSYTDAYELVSGYNNTFLDMYSGSDPLYKSSGGGLYFVYSLKLNNGEYICADNNYQKEITQKTERPDTSTDQVSC